MLGENNRDIEETDLVIRLKVLCATVFDGGSRVECLESLRISASSLEDTSGKRRLTNDGMQGTYAEFVVIGYHHGRRRIWPALLHHDMAALAANFDEAVISEQSTEFFPGENSETTQPLPRVA